MGRARRRARNSASRGVSLSVNDAASMPGAAASATSTTDYARINFGSFDSQGSASSDASPILVSDMPACRRNDDSSV